MSNASHTLAHNIMSDWTVQEKEALLGRKRSNKHENATEIASQPFAGNLSYFNWQSKLKSMQRIKNQGSCGSCWAFSTIGSVEAAWEIATGEELDLSEQQVVDCATGNCSGCDGGLYECGLTYLQDAGFEAEESYKYTQTTNACTYNKSKVVNHCIK